MRDILFRGKPVHQEDYTLNKNVKWSVGYFKGGFVYGSLIVKHNKYYICVGVAGVLLNSLVNNATTTLIEVIPETVGQYTGITDKNGTKIFEGDIVERFWLGEKHIYIIGYDNDIASFIGKDICSENFTTFNYDACMFEIIGNIHDNPKLLEEQK